MLTQKDIDIRNTLTTTQCGCGMPNGLIIYHAWRASNCPSFGSKEWMIFSNVVRTEILGLKPTNPKTREVGDEGAKRKRNTL